jgi:integrase
MPVQDIGTRDLLRMLELHWRERTVTPKKLGGRVEAVLKWATVSGHRKGEHPAAWRGNLKELRPAPGKVAKAQNQPALSRTDAPRWWGDLRQREGMAARALECLTLTAARSGEVRGMKWDEVDLGSGGGRRPVCTIPASRMKNGREHRVPLTPEAAMLLDAPPRMDGSPYVFFAPRGGMLSDMSISAVMRRMQEAEVKAGHPGYLDPHNKRPAMPHGLRSTFRQWAAEKGCPRDMAEIEMAHFIGSEVERAYQRSDMLDRRREMMVAWAAFMRSESTLGGNVIKLEQASEK